METPFELTVTCCPRNDENPYLRLIGQGFERLGVRSVGVSRPTVRWALSAQRHHDILHLHWLEFIVRGNEQRPFPGLVTLVRTTVFLLVLLILKARRVRVVWTVHNLLPHEPRHRGLELAVNRLTARLADVVIAHSQHSARVAERAYGVRGIRVAHHPNFIDGYVPPTWTREEVREKYGIPLEAHTVIAFGQARAYKRLPALVQALKDTGRDDLHLMILGSCRSDGLRDEIHRAIDGDPRVTARLEFISDDLVTAVHAAADVAVLNYDDVFSSGALMLALSCGVPVIAPGDSTATEIGEPPVVQPYPPGGLSAALAASADLRQPPTPEAVEAVARSYSWEALAEAVIRTPDRV